MFSYSTRVRRPGNVEELMAGTCSAPGSIHLACLSLLAIRCRGQVAESSSGPRPPARPERTLREADTVNEITDVPGRSATPLTPSSACRRRRSRSSRHCGWPCRSRGKRRSERAPRRWRIAGWLRARRRRFADSPANASLADCQFLRCLDPVGRLDEAGIDAVDADVVLDELGASVFATEETAEATRPSFRPERTGSGPSTYRRRPRAVRPR